VWAGRCCEENQRQKIEDAEKCPQRKRVVELEFPLNWRI